MPDSTNKEQVEALAKTITELRKRPLLVLFYPGDLPIREMQIMALNLRMKLSHIDVWHPLPELDVLLQTTGGDPVTAYRLAQVIRNVGTSVEFLVPEYAYSGGTLMCLSGDKILMGDTAVVSPFDITLTERRGKKPEDTFPDETPEDEVELVAIDHFIQVAKQARIEIERGFRQRGWKLSKTDVESQMLCEMVRQVGVLPVAHYYREKNIAQEYASELLRTYMFDNDIESEVLEKKLRRLTTEAPSHEFPMDFHICKDIGLKVEEMSEELSNATQALAAKLDHLPSDRTLFPRISGQLFPLFQLFPYTPAETKDDAEDRLAEEPETSGESGPASEGETIPEYMKPASLEESSGNAAAVSTSA